jgi:hypothetical protein
LILTSFEGTEFKTTACPITGAMRYMELQRGKNGMKNLQFNQQLGATGGCTLRLLLNSIPNEVTKNMVSEVILGLVVLKLQTK